MAKWNPKYSTSSSVMSLNSSQSFVLPKPTLKMEKLKMRIWYNGILCACLYKNRVFYDGKNSRTFAVVGLFFPESKKVTRLLVFVLLQIYKSTSSFHCDVLFLLPSRWKEVTVIKHTWWPTLLQDEIDHVGFHYKISSHFIK